MKRNIYGIFIGSKWCVCTNKREAIAFVKQYIAEGFISCYVRAMSLDNYNSAGSWDSPTFYACSNGIYGYN